MSARATAIALALLLVAVSAPAVAPMCCALQNTAERTIISSMDCCAATLECPIAQEATVTAASPSATPALRALSLCPQSCGLPNSATPFACLAVALTIPGPALSGPPAYLLHSQLLI